jgi:NAD(P)-dependent dehydrogenase (short-subunit alcohol dehydrogenase family)
MFQLDGKVAIVTGGASGIGLATGRLFAEQGAKVLLVDLQEDFLRAAVEKVDSTSVSYATADVSQPDQTAQYVQTAIDRYGGLDILISNAGVVGGKSFIVDYSIEEFDRVVAVNLRGVWLSLKYAIPEIQKRGGGSIVITSSIAGVKGSAGGSAYCASKHGVVGIMRTAAIECAPFGIRVNTVHPGPIETPMVEEHVRGRHLDTLEEGKKALADTTLLKRYGAPEEVAATMLYLASDESGYCTGGIYMVDGGKGLI